jgi:hypothetical protein
LEVVGGHHASGPRGVDALTAMPSREYLPGMGTLNVSSYRVGTNRSRTDPGAHRYYLSLQGTSEEGAATSAIVYFWPDPPTDTVGHLADTLLVGLLPDEDFAGWYDILRAERPVKVFYVEGGASGTVFHIGVGTDPEAVGEGPSNLSS